MVGSWVGTLEYRDYSEPAASTKRVKLPTWLTVTPNEAGVQFNYVYDDGPGKNVTETSKIRIDANNARYVVTNEESKNEESYAIEGLDKLKQGRGTLVLRGAGTENKAAVDVRATLRVGRNIIEIIRETGPSGTPPVFRHAYTFVRMAAPVVSLQH